MKTVSLDYASAHEFVESNSYRGYFWDGWNIIRWVPNSDGYAKSNGMFRNGMWGFAYKFPMENNGKWTVKVPNA